MNGNTKNEEPSGFLSRLLRRKAKTRPFSAQEWFQEGFSIMHSSSDYDHAIRAFTSCLQMDPANARAFLSRGIAHECINNTDAAFADYSKAIELLPEDGKAYYMRGMLRWRMCDETAIHDMRRSAGLEYKPAKDFLDRKAPPANQSPHSNIGRSLQEEAIRVLTESIRSAPSNAGTYLNRGMAYERVNHMQHAIADYGKAIQLAPDSAKAYYARGTLLWYLEDDTSIRDLMTAAALGYEPAKEFLRQASVDGTKTGENEDAFRSEQGKCPEQDT